ncbi:unnamed protein product [Closterium sp. NIES-53]
MNYERVGYKSPPVTALTSKLIPPPPNTTTGGREREEVEVGNWRCKTPPATPHPPLSATPITLPPTDAGAGRGTGRARTPLPCHLPLTRHLPALQKQARAGKATEGKKTGPGGGKRPQRPPRALSPRQIFPSPPPPPPPSPPLVYQQQ